MPRAISSSAPVLPPDCPAAGSQASPPESGALRSGKLAEKLLDEAGITCNKNTIPYDQEKPFVTSGIRLGTAAMTSRGFKEEQFQQVANWIYEVLTNKDDASVREKVRQEVRAVMENFPLPDER